MKGGRALEARNGPQLSGVKYSLAIALHENNNKIMCMTFLIGMTLGQRS